MTAPSDLPIGLIWAEARDRVIGADGGMPWHVPEDLAHFKAATLGAPVVMGRRTWESFPARFRPLPGRRNIVMTRGAFSAPGVDTVHSLDEAQALVAGEPEMMIIGGAEVFRLAMPRMTHIHLTRVHCRIDGDVFMPEIAPGEWREVSREEHAADARNACALTFTLLERVAAPAAR